MSHKYEMAPKDCVGPTSEEAGFATPCQGCPNQAICSSGKLKTEDPDLPLILSNLQKVKKVIIVLSGKGGVGKSTVSACLARSFARKCDSSYNVGLLDLDLCGPSIPRMMGLEGESVHQSSSGWSAIMAEENLSVMSVGFLLGSLDDAVIWRGAKKNGLIKQFLRDVDWGELDYLIIDVPPGTSDEHITSVSILQKAVSLGAIVVTTPQELSILDVQKEITFCKKLKLKLIGVVENMSYFMCPNCNASSTIYPSQSGGAEKLCKDVTADLLVKIPLDPTLGKSCDEGTSFFDLYPEHQITQSYDYLCEKVQNFFENNSYK